MKEYVFTLKTARSRYSAQTMPNAYYTDDRALLANAPTQIQSLQYIQKQAAGVIDSYMNANKIEFTF